MFRFLDSRERVPELMDDPHLDVVSHRHALSGLARANRLSRSADILWPAIAKLARKSANPLRILDVATGSGDVPLAVAERARRNGVRLDISACDISDTALSVAREHAREARVSLRFFRHDVIAEPLPSGFDVVTCSLFLHHLSESDAITVLRRLRDAAARLVLVNDMERSVLGYALAWLASRMVTRSPVVHFDGPASARSAFTPAEALALAESAGLPGSRVTPKFPCRYLLEWHRR